MDLDLVRVAVRQPDSLRPDELALSDQAAVIVSDLLYDGLTEAVGGDDRLRPALALDWWPNDDFTEWTFLLDRERVTADEVVGHFRELLSIEGNPAVSPLLAGVGSVEPGAFGDEVVFSLVDPNAGFAWLVSGLGASVIGENERTTGRYQMSVTGDQDALLEPRDAGAPLPDVALTWTDDHEAAYDLLTLGVVDAAVAPVDSLPDAERRFGFVPSARSIVRFYVLNTDSPRLADERVRSLLRRAIDRAAVVAGLDAGRGVPIDGLLTPGLAGFAEGGCGEACDGGPDAAPTAIAVPASEGSGAPLTIAVSADADPDLAEALADNITKAGFDVAVERLGPEALAQAIANGSADLIASGWVAGAASIDAVVPQLLEAPSVVGGSVSGSPALDELLAEASRTADDHERWTLLAEAHLIAAEHGSVVPIAAASSRFVVAPQVAGIVVRPDGSLDLEASR